MDLECRTPRFSGFKHFLAVLLDYMNMKLLHSILPQMLGVEMLLIYEKEVSAYVFSVLHKELEFS